MTVDTPTPQRELFRRVLGWLFSNIGFFVSLAITITAAFVFPALKGLLWKLDEELLNQGLLPGPPCLEFARVPLLWLLLGVEVLAIALILFLVFRLVRAGVRTFRRQAEDGEPRFIWMERWNAPIYMGVIAIGVPLMSMFVSSMNTKWVIIAVWFGLASPLYLFLEGREIRGQMVGRGAIDSTQATSQIRTGQLPYWGVIAAFIVWLGGMVAYVVGNWPQVDSWETILFLARAPWNTSITYGVEWLILIHTIYMARISTVTMDGILGEFLKATPRAERSERRVP